MVSPRVAARLAPVLRDAAHRAARDGMVLDPEVRQVLDEVFRVARAVRNRDAQVSDSPGTVGTGAEDDRAIVGDVVGCGQVAAQFGVSESLVRRWARDGRLPGRRTSTGWEFDQLDVDEFERNRHERTR